MLSLRSPKLHAAIIGPALLWFSPVLFFGRVFYSRDNGLYFFPHASMIAQSLREGRLPQWNPFEYGGVPLLADPNFNLFHPLALLDHFLPLPWGFSFFLFATALSGAYGARALARSLGLDEAGSLAAALFFAWAGPTLSLILSGQAVASCFIPWLCAAGARVSRLPLRRALIEVSIAGALVFCAGTPEVGACGFALAGILAVSESLLANRTVEDAKTPRDRSGGWLAAIRSGATYLAGCALAAGLSAAQLLPSAAFLRVSSRAAGFDLTHASTFALEPLRLLGVVIPFFTGSPDAPGTPSWIFGARDPAYVQELYAGAGVFALALLGVRAAGSLRRAPLLIVAVALIPIAMGPHLPLYQILWTHLPALRTIRFPEKFAVPLSLAIAISAGAGWERLCAYYLRAVTPLSSRAYTLVRENITLAASLFFLLLAGLAVSPHLWGQSLESRMGTLSFQCFCATALSSTGLELSLAALFLLILRGRWQGRLTGTAARLGTLLLLAAELAMPALRLNTTAKASDVTRPAALARLLVEDARASLWTFRFTSQPLGMTGPQLDALASEGEPRSRALFHLRRAQLLDAGAGLSGLRSDRGYSGFTAGALHDLYTRAQGGAALDLLGVRYGIEMGFGPSILRGLGWIPRDDLARTALSRERDLSPESPLFVYENPRAGRFAWLSAAVLPERRLIVANATDADQPSDLIPRCNGAITPWLSETDLRALPASIPVASGCDGVAAENITTRVIMIHATREALELDTDAIAPALLVTTETALPGWRAFVDDAETPLLAAFGALRACAVPPGRHRVRFSYQAPGLRAGLYISLAALVTLAALFISWRPKSLPISAIAALLLITSTSTPVRAELDAGSPVSSTSNMSNARRMAHAFKRAAHIQSRT